jgi:Uma2 family endonuclease
VPDVHIYPEGQFRTMPSMAHERARTLTTALLGSVAAPTDLMASELALLWNPRDLREHLVPDILVALGVGDLDPVYGILRRQYRAWDEGKVPDLIVEYASPSTVVRDMLGKKEDYARLGVREYVQFDPLEESFQPGLRVYRLRRKSYREVPAGTDGAVPSLVLVGYEWVQMGLHLRLRERKTRRLVATAEEAWAREAAARLAAEEARAAAEQAQSREAARAAAAEAELARLRAEIARLRADVDAPRE